MTDGSPLHTYESISQSDSLQQSGDVLPFAAPASVAGSDLALDLGTTAFRSLRRDGNRLVARREAAAYTVVPGCSDSERLLRDAGVPFSRTEGGLVVAGEAALQLARSFESPVVPLLPGGEIPKGDPVGRQVAAMLLDAVLGDRDSLRGRVCLMTVPGSPGVSETTASLRFFTQLVSLAGLTPQVMHAGSAAAAAAFAHIGLRGIGVSFGASHVDIGLIVRGYETGWHRVPIGGDTIDARLIDDHAAYLHNRHGHRFPDFLAVREWKQSPARSLIDADPTSRTLAEGYGDLALSAAEAVRDLLAKHRETGPAQPFSLVATGGPTGIAGFETLWDAALRRADVMQPLECATITSDREYEVARGLLLLTEAGVRRAAA